MCCVRDNKLKNNQPSYSTKLNHRATVVNYKLNIPKNISERGPYHNQCEFIIPYLPKESNLLYPQIHRECYTIKKISNNKKIILLYIKNNFINHNKSKFTILYSHTDKEDLGKIYPFLVDLSIMLKTDVVSYDYSGYGLSEGKTGEKEMLSDIEEVAKFCVNNLKVNKENLILFGKSIGTLPTIHIGSMDDYLQIRGIILLNAICTKSKYNIFEMANGIMCPCFIIYGKNNRDSDFKDSEEIKKRIKNSSLWKSNNLTNDNLMTKYRVLFYQYVRKFLEVIFKSRFESLEKKMNLNDLSVLSNQEINEEVRKEIIMKEGVDMEDGGMEERKIKNKNKNKNKYRMGEDNFELVDKEDTDENKVEEEHKTEEIKENKEVKENVEIVKENKDGGEVI